MDSAKPNFEILGGAEEIVSSLLTLRMIRRQPVDDDYVAHVVDIVLPTFRNATGEA